MNNEDLELLTEEGKKIIKDLSKIIPSWRDLDLTKKGYNEQYIQTLLDVAVYVVERENAVLREM